VENINSSLRVTFFITSQKQHKVQSNKFSNPVHESLSTQWWLQVLLLSLQSSEQAHFVGLAQLYDASYDQQKTDTR